MYKKQIAKGIKLLDEEVPGWRRKVDLEKLYMGHCGKCILGQVVGSPDDNVSIFRLLAGALGLKGWNNIASHGFDVRDGGNYVALTDEWKEALGGSDDSIAEGGRKSGENG